MRLLTADPALTASIYCDGGLDAALDLAVRPWWESLSAHHSGLGLWTVRYSRGGEHLKLRLHAPPDTGPEVRESWRTELAERTDSLWRELPGSPVPHRDRRRQSAAPPIDPQDEGDGDPKPDRHLVWTDYRRSPVSLGAPPLPDHDPHVRRLVTCLAAGTALALEVIRPAPSGEYPTGPRRSALLNAVVQGLAVLPRDQRTPYLVYHRDWLLRFVADDDAAEDELRHRMEEQVASAGGTVRSLAAMIPPAWDPEATSEGDDSPWRAAVRDLADHAASLAPDDRFQVDPFADTPVLPAVFKAFHGLANQLGVAPAQEAFLHHLCLRSVEQAGTTAAGVNA